jgi:hypothetical protein
MKVPEMGINFFFTLLLFLFLQTKHPTMAKYSSLKRLEGLAGKKGLEDLDLPTITDAHAEDVVGMYKR